MGSATLLPHELLREAEVAEPRMRSSRMKRPVMIVLPAPGSSAKRKLNGDGDIARLPTARG
jgi:hypothetical protein